MSTATGPEQAVPRFVGASVRRREDPRLLTGRGRYVDDVALPNMVHAAFVRSPLARARIVRAEAGAARQAPGVRGVWVGGQQPLAPMPESWVKTPAALPEAFPLAIGDVRFVGDPVALVVAESRALAEDACELIEVDYDPLEPLVDYRLADDAEAPRVHPDLDSNLAFAAQSPEDPALERAFESADHVFTETIRQHRYLNVPMETRGMVSLWDPGREELTVWLSTQHPHQDRTMFARATGLPENQVRVIMDDVGGAFGQKAFHGRDQFAVIAASIELAIPVKWIEDRHENLTAASHAREEQMTVSFAVAADGTIEAARVAYLGDAGAYPLIPPHIVPSLATRTFPGPYRVPHYGWSARAVYTNTSGLGPYRGPWMMETTARETMLDLLARELDIDPVEIRRRNVLRDEDLPYETQTGMVYEAITPAATLEQALEIADYGSIAARKQEALGRGRRLGVGVSCFIEPTAMGGHGPSGIEAATIRVEPTGKVSVLMGTGSHGQSLETTMPQVVADELGVPIEDVILVQGDTRISPFGGGTGGSRSAVMAGNVARVAAAGVREKVLEIASHLLEAAPADLVIYGGTITVVGSPTVSLPFAEVARISLEEPGQLPEGMEPGLEVTSRFPAPAPATHSNAGHVCVCEVDPSTGTVEILDYVASEDCGVMINPMVVEGQIAGGVIQGIGGVLFEHAAYDSAGNPLATTFKDYLLPTAHDVPTIRFGHVESRSRTPGGHKGMGEGGAIGSPAAVVNAIADALAPIGVRITEQPLHPSRLLGLIEEAKKANSVEGEG